MPNGIVEDRFIIIVAQFIAGDLTNSQEFIEAHTRLAVTVGLQYHFDEAVEIALTALCNFPSRLQSKPPRSLKQPNVIKYLLSQMHYACLHEMQYNNKLFGPSRNNTVVMDRCDDTVLDEVTTPSNESYIYLVSDLEQCVTTEFDRLVLHKFIEGNKPRDIASLLYVNSESKVKRSLHNTFERYKQSLTDLEIWLPYPDYRSCILRLRHHELRTIIRFAKSILSGEHYDHPTSAMWRYNKFALCEYAVRCADALGDADSVLYFVRRKDRLVDSGNPPHFDLDNLNREHRQRLYKLTPSHYCQYWSPKGIINKGEESSLKSNIICVPESTSVQVP